SVTGAGKHDAIDQLAQLTDANQHDSLSLNLDDVPVPGVVDPTNALITFERLKEAANRQPFLDNILRSVYDPVPHDADEAAFFSSGVKAVDNSIATLRLVEGRVQAYRVAMEACRRALTALYEPRARAEKRPAAIGD